VVKSYLATLKRVKLKPGPVSLVLLLITAILFLAAIWTRDERYSLSAAVFLFPGVGFCLAWLIIEYGN